MHDMPFKLADERELDEESLKALNATTDHFSQMFKMMDAGTNHNLVIPEYDRALNAIKTVIDGDDLYFHRIRERSNGNPLTVFSYVTFFGDRGAAIAAGLDPMDEAPCLQDITEDLLHFIIPIKVLHPNCFNELVMSDTAHPLTTTSVPFYISDPNNENSILSKLETDLMIEIN